MRFADERVAAIIRGTRALRLIDFPGREGVQVAVRLLSGSEVDDACIAAAGALRTQMMGRDLVLFTDVAPKLLDQAQRREMIARAFYDASTADAERPVQFFADATVVGRECDAPTIERLFAAYLEHQRSVAAPTSLSDGEVDDAVGAVALGEALPHDVTALDDDTLRRLCVAMSSALSIDRS